MLQLLSPAALFALSALALPLAIHLWRPPPRTVRLGSLRFLENLPHRRLRNLRWREHALLTVRCLLLTALSLLLAAPEWVSRPPRIAQRWILLDPAAVPAGASRARLDELRTAGYSLRRLAPGFPVLDAPPVAPDQRIAQTDTWSLLREADAVLPGGSSLAVVTAGRASELRGRRPALARVRVEWIVAPDRAAPTPWIASARRLPAGAVRVVVGASDADSTRFSTIEVSAGSTDAVELSPDGKKVRARASTPEPWTAVTPPRQAVRLLIVHDPDRADDAHHIAAATRAVTMVDGVEITTTLSSTATPPALAGQDWVVWLSTRELPTAPAAVPDVLREQVGGEPRPVESWIVPTDSLAPAAAELGAVPVRLWRVGTAMHPATGNVWWTDAEGSPLFTLEQTSGVRRWTFASRFSPAWNDLSRSGALPALWRALLSGPRLPSLLNPAQDVRLADPTQYQASLVPPTHTPRRPTAAATETIDLRLFIWGAAVVFFVVERALSLWSGGGPRYSQPDAAPVNALASR